MWWGVDAFVALNVLSIDDATRLSAHLCLFEISSKYIISHNAVHFSSRMSSSCVTSDLLAQSGPTPVAHRSSTFLAILTE